MREKPIIFSSPMVRVILEGRKTQTRRVINPQPPSKPCRCAYTPGGWSIESEPNEFGAIGCLCGHKTTPRYDVDDVLWVRETWAKKTESGETVYYYKADYTEVPGLTLGVQKWRPSIHMPRVAARLFLRVTDVRAERLQEITIRDARAEGVLCDCPDNDENRCYKGNVGHFRELWCRESRWLAGDELG
jgi:hypothetical protein